MANRIKPHTASRPKPPQRINRYPAPPGTPGAEMFGQLEMIGPKRAKELLAKSRGNRLLRRPRVAQMCRDRRNGLWRIHSQGIDIDEEGYLTNGHHRLAMILETGLDTPIFVTYGMPMSGALYIDSNLPRSHRDALSMANQGEYTNSMIAVANYLTDFPVIRRRETLSREEIKSRLIRHEEAIMFATTHAIGRGITKAVRSLVARAYYHVDTDRLKEFCQVIRSRFPVSDNAQYDHAAMRYSDLVLQRNLRLTGSAIEMERYQKGQSALAAFLECRPLMSIKATKVDMFPLPLDPDEADSNREQTADSA